MLSSPGTGRISLYDALHFGNSDTLASLCVNQAQATGKHNKVSQTSEMMMSDVECRAIVEKMVGDVVAEAHAAFCGLERQVNDLGNRDSQSLRLLQTRLDDLEAKAKEARYADFAKPLGTCEVASKPALSEPKYECIDQRQNLPASSISFSSSNVSMNIQSLKDQHRAERLAQKEARRSARSSLA